MLLAEGDMYISRNMEHGVPIFRTLMIVALFLHLSTIICVGAIPSAQKEALEEIRDLWNISHWIGEPTCDGSWDGISCNWNEDIISMTLRDSGISGSIPPSIMNFVRLESLNIGDNQISGTLPDNFTEFIYLKIL